MFIPRKNYPKIIHACGHWSFMWGFRFYWNVFLTAQLTHLPWTKLPPFWYTTFPNEFSWLKFVPMNPINNKPALVQVMAWLPELRMAQFTDAYSSTRGRWGGTVDSDKDLTLCGRQAIIWTKYKLIYWRIYASRDLDKLNMLLYFRRPITLKGTDNRNTSHETQGPSYCVILIIRNGNSYLPCCLCQKYHTPMFRLVCKLTCDSNMKGFVCRDICCNWANILTIQIK